MKLDKIEVLAVICSIIVISVSSIIFIIGTEQINTDKQIFNKNENITNGTITNGNITNGTIPKNVCEGCHLSGRGSIPQATSVEPHLDGGKYCLECHNFSHDTHPINKDVTCEKCHGLKNESIPVSGPNIVCINCHDYPNPLEKSFGNLISIHRPRGVSCINCHADRCENCHKEVINDSRWDKRLIHFWTILGNKFIS